MEAQREALLERAYGSKCSFSRARRRRLEVLRPRLDAAGVDLGDVQQLGEQAFQRVDRAVDAVDQVRHLGIGADAVAQRLGEQAQRMQRLAQVVAGGGEELRLGAVGRLGLAPRSVGDRLSERSCTASASVRSFRPTMLSNDAR